MSTQPLDEQSPRGTLSGGPVPPQERIILLDVLRGFAILGIILVNYNLTVLHVEALSPSAVNRTCQLLVEILGHMKFWPLFALLFGVGLAIQMERAETHDKNILPKYLRRLLFLFFFGGALDLIINVPYLLMLSEAGVWALLIAYGVRRRRVSWMVVAILCVLAVYIINMSAVEIPGKGLSGPPDVTAAEVAAKMQGFRASVEKSNEEEATSWRFDKWVSRLNGRLGWYYRYLPRNLVRFWGNARLVLFMLLGILLWRLGVFKKVGEHRRFFLWLLAITLPIGLGAGSYIATALNNAMLTVLGLGAYPTPLQRLIWFPMYITASLSMSLAYTGGIALLMQRPLLARLLNFFAPVGKMALSNYALQAVLPPLLFGYYTPGIPRATLGSSMVIITMIGLFGLQAVISHAWLRSHKFGPLEWLWRSVTYWKLQPMRRQ